MSKRNIFGSLSSSLLFSLACFLSSVTFAQSSSAQETPTRRSIFQIIKKEKIPPVPLPALKENYKEEISKNIYHNIGIESFEKKSHNIRLRAQGEDGLKSKTFSVSGFGGNSSNKFLAVIYSQKDFLPLYLDFKTPFSSADCLHSISVWVYATNSNGRLQVLLYDNRNNPFTLSFGHLDFKGWRKLTAIVPPQFIQLDDFPNQNRPFTIKNFFYIPSDSSTPTKYLKHSQIFYLDEISVRVRPKIIWQFEK